ncbi:MAG: 3-dehydroquinate synthase [Treponema sp.]|nr:3-dehydroquinate synthase [Treponema sp.]
MLFSFGNYKTCVHIIHEIPEIGGIFKDVSCNVSNTLLIADENTAYIAQKITCDLKLPLCILKSGEDNKSWQSVQTIIEAARNAGLGRDGVFIAVGGGVIGDIAGFAASIYMRGCRLVMVPTTLLSMVDASVGGKTGFDLFDIKNLAGSFYPAENVYIPLKALLSLPQKEMKSGMAELIKTAILCGGNFLEELYSLCGNITEDALFNFIKRAVKYKGSIVKTDPLEKGKKRILLNLGHTFGHALESASGLGNITHGEAVAWGIARSCELGIAFGITPKERAKKIKDLLTAFDYYTACPHYLVKDNETLINAMYSDKKKRDGKLTFIIPDKNSAHPLVLETENELNILRNILSCTSTI